MSLCLYLVCSLNSTSDSLSGSVSVKSRTSRINLLLARNLYLQLCKNI